MKSFSRPPSREIPKEGRFDELDAMRGLAALIVIFHHFRNLYYSDAFNGRGISSFLYPLVSGHESVLLFFLLSGFVLSLPYLRGKELPYFVFLQKRIIRIYGPYFIALILSIIGCALWHGSPDKTWSAPPDFYSILQHVLFLGGYQYTRYNTAFWSLVYEMRISIIFPFLFFIASRLKTQLTLFATGILFLVSVPNNYPTLEYIGIFFFGILLAKHLEDVRAAYVRLNMINRILFGIIAFAIYEGYHLIRNVGSLWHFDDTPIIFGAAGLMIIGLSSPTARYILKSPLLVALGRVSYSLYLVHGIVLYTLASVLKNVNPLIIFCVYIPTALIFAWCFYLAVEMPFIQLSHKVKKLIPEYKPLPANPAISCIPLKNQ